MKTDNDWNHFAQSKSKAKKKVSAVPKLTT